VKLGASPVLTVNHVFDILLEYQHSGDWLTSFLKVLPKRKMHQPDGQVGRRRRRQQQRPPQELEAPDAGATDTTDEEIAAVVEPAVDDGGGRVEEEEN
jgi:hypothetical protein